MAASPESDGERDGVTCQRATECRGRVTSEPRDEDGDAEEADGAVGDARPAEPEEILLALQQSLPDGEPQRGQPGDHGHPECRGVFHLEQGDERAMQKDMERYFTRQKRRILEAAGGDAS